jgi:two-component system, chemotaxis family, protein-glutamate methylesterase/glutaminase
MRYNAVVIGASSGGIDAIINILMSLKEGFPVPIVIVQHLSPKSDGYIIEYLNKLSRINVKEAEEKEGILQGNVYIAPPNYHLLIERDRTLSLTVEPKVNYSRPAIDVLFESAADAYNNKLIGIILTGANSDGSKGLKRIKELGGITIVQDPKNAEVDTMPMAAIDVTEVDYILPLNEIGNKLVELIGDGNE